MRTRWFYRLMHPFGIHWWLSMDGVHELCPICGRKNTRGALPEEDE